MVAGMNDEQSGVTTVFENYWKQVREELGLPVSERRSFIRQEAIDLLKRDWRTLDGKQTVRRLFDSLASEGWKETPGSNWISKALPPGAITRPTARPRQCREECGCC